MQQPEPRRRDEAILESTAAALEKDRDEVHEAGANRPEGCADVFTGTLTVRAERKKPAASPHKRKSIDSKS